MPGRVIIADPEVHYLEALASALLQRDDVRARALLADPRALALPLPVVREAQQIIALRPRRYRTPVHVLRLFREREAARYAATAGAVARANGIAIEHTIQSLRPAGRRIRVAARAPRADAVRTGPKLDGLRRRLELVLLRRRSAT